MSHKKNRQKNLLGEEKLLSPEAIDCALFQLVRKFGGRLFMIASANYSDNLWPPSHPQTHTALAVLC